MSEVLPNLFIGSLKVAQDQKFLKEKKIRHILSCGKFSFPGGINPKIIKRHKEIDLKDNHIEPIKFYFWEAYNFIS